MSVKIVPHYGIHWDDRGVAWLMQGRGSSNAISLKERVPFRVELPNRKRHCNHQIQLAAQMPNDYHWNYLMQLMDDELVRAMLPLPKQDGGVYFVEDDNDTIMPYLIMLAKLSSPIYSPVVPVWTLTLEAIVTELQQTNVQPFVLSGVEAKHSSIIQQAAKAAVYLPRKLVLAGHKDVVLTPQIKRIKTSIRSYDLNEMMTLPWESLGARIVRSYMRKEFTNPQGGSYDQSGRRQANSPS